MRMRADVYAFRSASSRENTGAPVMRWVRTTLPWMSMTVTETDTFSSADSASTRSAMVFAVVSRSMVVRSVSESEMGGSVSALAIEAHLSHVESESIFRVSGFLEPVLQEGLDSLLRRRSPDGGHARVPAGSDLDVGRQAGFVDEVLGVGDGPLVERGDPGCESVDEVVQLAIRQRAVHVAEALGIGASDVVCAQEHFERACPSHDPRQSCHGPAAGDEAHAHFELRQERLLAAREAHVAGERELTAVSGCPPPDQRDRDERGARQAHQDVGPRLEAGRTLREAGQILEVREEVGVIQKEAVDGTFEDHHVHSLIALQLRH